MKNPCFRKVHVFFSSLFICLLHLPFVFAKSRSKMDLMPATLAAGSLTVSETGALQPLLENNIHAGAYERLKLASLGLAKQAFDYAMNGLNYMKKTGSVANQDIISIVDFSEPSFKKRLFIIDLKNYRVLFNTYVAHGANSGREFANCFSNVPESNKSSLGFYKTAETYIGKHGYSLHLSGLEKGINDNAYKRDIVIHGAGYVNENMIRSTGYIGRSWGCPAVPENLSRPIIDKIKNGSCLFIFGRDRNYFSHSELLKTISPLPACNG